MRESLAGVSHVFYGNQDSFWRLFHENERMSNRVKRRVDGQTDCYTEADLPLKRDREMDSGKRTSEEASHALVHQLLPQPEKTLLLLLKGILVPVLDPRLNNDWSRG